MNDIEAAARQLLSARITGRAIALLPPGATPRSLEEAYAIQDAQMRALAPVGGWKVGAKSPDAEPTCAPLPASGIHASPHRFDATRFPLRLVEAEIGFRIGRDLPARARPYTEQDVLDAVASVHGTIELLATRFSDAGAVDALALLADFISHGALVVGAGDEVVRAIDQMRTRVQLYVDDVLDVDITGGNAAGDVVRLLGWLANHVAVRSGGLRAGDIVTTGSCIGMRPVPPGARVKAVVGNLPPVEIEL
jgi:2-keto-4-pentenoate hydratase